MGACGGVRHGVGTATWRTRRSAAAAPLRSHRAPSPLSGVGRTNSLRSLCMALETATETTTQTAPAPEPAAPTTPDWRESLPEELRAEPSFKDVPDVPTLEIGRAS